MAETIEVRISPEHKAQLDTIKAERRLTYSEVVKAALEAYFTPAPSSTNVMHDRLAGTSMALEQIQQRLWGLDSASQKTVERLTKLEDDTQCLPDLLEAVRECQELLIQFAASPRESLASAASERTRTDEQPNTRETRLQEPPAEADTLAPAHKSWWRGAPRLDHLHPREGGSR
jgi:hypothetical protein